MGIKSGFKSFGKWLNDHDPEVSTGVAIVLNVLNLGFAFYESKKMFDELNELKKKKGGDLNSKERVPVILKHAAPVAAVAIASSAIDIRGTKVALGRIDEVTEAYHSAVGAFDAFAAQTLATVGEKKYEEIQQNVVKQQISNIPVEQTNGENGPIYRLNGDRVIPADQFPCLDTHSHCVFVTTWQKVDAVMKEVAREVENGDYVPIDDIYVRLDTRVAKGQNAFKTRKKEPNMGYQDVTTGEFTYDIFPILDEETHLLWYGLELPEPEPSWLG